MSEVTPPLSPVIAAPPQRQVIDVSALPDSAFDWRDPVWWGNTLAIIIESVTIALIVVAYFYIRRNYTVFPPPKVDLFPPIYDTAPLWKWGTTNLVLMLGGCVPMFIVDRYARHLRRWPCFVGLVLMLLLTVACCYVRWQEFHGLKFWWNDNAYASCEWIMLGTHATYLLAAGIEFFLMAAWILTHELDAHHGLDVTLCGGYWYWLSIVFLVVYLVLYVSPRAL